HGTPPFDRITVADYEPAVDRGIELGRKEIEALANNPEAPTFENTIVAMARSGRDLDRVLNVFYPLLSSLSDDSMMELSMKLSPRLSEYSTAISLNEPLWQRIRTVYETTDTTALTPEQKTLLKRTYEGFARSGALLEGADRDTYRQLSSRLSELTTKFGQNVLKELNTYEVWLTKDDLSGLPESSVEAAALAASEKGRGGEYLFTLDQPVYSAFLKFSDRRDLREKMYRLYTGRNTKGEYNNLPVMKEIAETRLKLANLLGYPTYADYSLANTMAGTPAKVNALLGSLRDAYRPALDAEMKELAEYASSIEGHPVTIEPWDYSYYAYKLKNAKYAYDEEEMRPYFELSNVIDGVFGLATRLYGLTFEKNDSIPVYHPDVNAYDVRDRDGSFVGVIYTDFFPRASKRPGAWMTEFKTQKVTADGVDERPQVTIVMNFTKPTATKPSLLTPYE
ncbi:MAG: M3 family metallopeptidase, partial [Duncaniella sp.]|nr:M3 family metallopeptidase [Duncaniella sp.]